MPAIPEYEYDEEAAMQETIARLHKEWSELYTQSTSGQKGQLTKLKKYYTRLAKTDLEAAVIMLSINEHVFEHIRKNKVNLTDKKLGVSLADFVDYR